MPPLRLACVACGWMPTPLTVSPYPFRCPRGGADDGDHIVARGAWMREANDRRRERQPVESDEAPDPNPFVRYRERSYAWHTARKHGLSDEEYVGLVEQLDASVAGVAGLGFRETPAFRADSLSDALGFGSNGGVWVKDETGGVSGSHKARHLMGVALYLQVLDRLAVDDPARPLAVASCGNAALAAAVVARAIGRKLLVFVPDHADAVVTSRLEELGASVSRCSRKNATAGDPSYLAFRDAIRNGALPFSCQGNENGLVIEGAMTLGYELLDQMNDGPDRLFVQVGGGALASACVQAFQEYMRGGRLASMPVIHAVQTLSASPLKRAYDLVTREVMKRLDEWPASTGRVEETFAAEADGGIDSKQAALAAYMKKTASPALLNDIFRYMRTHRSRFMWPWDSEPHSLATGILDDETYDWAVIVEAMIRSGGYPIVVDEETIAEANTLACHSTGIDVDHTGSAGLAGLLALSRSLDPTVRNDKVAVLFTGARRQAPALKS